MTDRLTFLGTSDGCPSADRRHAALLLNLAGQTVLVDCGEPSSQTLKQRGVDYSAIDAVVISHTHADHVGGLPMLLQAMWLEERTRPLTVWLAPHAIAPLQQWLRACYLFEPLLPFPLELRPLRESTGARIGPVSVRAYRTSHLDPVRDRYAANYPTVEFDAFCLLFEGNGKRIGYSGDLGGPQDLEPMLAQPLDLLVTELAHCHPDALLRFLQPWPVRRIALTHLGRPMQAKLPAIQKTVAELFRPGQVTFPADGDVIEIA